MNAYSLLHDSIAVACPSIHKKRLDTLCLAMKTLCFHQKASLSGIGRTLHSSAKTKHCIKRIDRLLGNTKLQAERAAIYTALIPMLIGQQKKPLILIDWSQINEEAGFHILRASLPTTGRALTLYEEVHPKSKSHNRQVHGAFLQQLKSLLPDDVTPIFITDAGFKNPWFKQVEALGWHWVGRIRHFTQFSYSPDNRWQQCRHLEPNASNTPQSLGEITLAKRNPLQCFAHLFKKPMQGRKKKTQGKRVSKRTNSTSYGRREREPWFLVTNLPPESLSAKQAVEVYKTRMQIEESFRDNKNQRIGLSLKETRSQHPSRLEVLLLIVTLATLALWLIGSLAKQRGMERGYQANTVKTRAVLSLFNLGIQVLRKTGMPDAESDEFRKLLERIPDPLQGMSR